MRRSRMYRPLTKTYCHFAAERAAAGGAARPATATSPPRDAIGRRQSARSGVNRLAARATVESVAGRLSVSRPLCRSENATPGLGKARRVSCSVMWPDSVLVVLRNFRRAGVLKNKSRMVTVVPVEAAQGTGSLRLSPLAETSHPSCWPAWRVRIWAWEMLAIDAKASPRKPIVLMLNRSSSPESLLVACGLNARAASARPIPQPSSATWINLLPPSSIDTSTREAPESRAFSTSSLTTLAGRSITSPAAILLTRCAGSFAIAINVYLKIGFLNPGRIDGSSIC